MDGFGQEMEVFWKNKFSDFSILWDFENQRFSKIVAKISFFQRNHKFSIKYQKYRLGEGN